MKTFYVSVQKGGRIFSNFNKVPVDLDTAANLGKQTEDFIASRLASMNIVYSEDEISWKLYRGQGSTYAWVSRSKNWAGDD